MDGEWESQAKAASPVQSRQKPGSEQPHTFFCSSSLPFSFKCKPCYFSRSSINDDLTVKDWEEWSYKML
jgi:hypothetical protein